VIFFECSKCACASAGRVLRNKTVFAKPFCPSNSLYQNENKLTFH
ncbi:MAG: hypothetical protein ACI9LN_004496, partial [Saprospiraceae bacterium]